MAYASCAKETRAAVLAVICAALTLASGRAISLDKEAQATLVMTHGRGTLRIVEGVPFLTLSGSYKQMGEEYGALMKERIAKYLPRGVGALTPEERRGLENRLGTRFAGLLQGIAEATGTSYDAILRGIFDLPVQGCSSVLAKVPAGEGRTKLLHAKNLDLPGTPPLEAQAVVELRPEGELRFLTTTILGFSDGMNERGISISLDAGSPCRQDPASPPPPGGAPELINNAMEALATARSLAEADRALTHVVPAGTQLVIVGSATEVDGVVIDLACGTVRRTMMGGEPYLFATNTFLHPDLTPPGTLLECPRYRVLADRLKRDRIAAADDLVGVLSDPGTSSGPNNVLTRQSAIYDAGAGVLRLAVLDGYAAWGKWLEYEWRRDRVKVHREALYRLGEPSLVRRPAAPVAALRATVESYLDQAALWHELEGVLAVAGLEANGPGRTVYHGNAGRQVDLEVVQPVVRLAANTGRVRFEVTSAVEVVSVEHEGPYATLAAVYQSLARWMAEHGYQRAGPSRETWVHGPWNEPDERAWRTIVEIPIASKVRE